MPAAFSEYVCPLCHADLTAEARRLTCRSCGAGFSAEGEIPDFSRGRYYDAFEPGQELPREHLEALRDEVEGTRRRIEDYYRPRLDRLARRRGCSPGELRILDCGCGNGVSVELLNAAGFSAWGCDLSKLRKWQWREMAIRPRLSVCDARRLPFRTGFFQAVVSSGLVEHIGVRETGEPDYRVEPAPDQQEQRREFVREMIRVVEPGGTVWLDFPNGRFPIDFWHGTGGRRGMRWHPPGERFLPSLREIRGYFAAEAPAARIRPISPHRRLHFRRVRRRWYGRLLFPLVSAFFRAVSLPGLGRLAGWAWNPYLVVEIRTGGSAIPPSLPLGSIQQ